MPIFSNSGFLMTKLKYRQGSEIVLNKSVHFSISSIDNAFIIPIYYLFRIN